MIALVLAVATPGCASTPPQEAPKTALSQTNNAAGAKAMSQIVEGTFNVKLIPQPAQSEAAGEAITRMLLDKQFFGALEAKSTGQMLAMRTSVAGSAGYVAMELVVGTLAGRTGSFALQHSGTMQGASKTLSLSVVPDSGTGELVGLSGTMEIIIEDGKHGYRFDYRL
jgi:hypothetical protein